MDAISPLLMLEPPGETVRARLGTGPTVAIMAVMGESRTAGVIFNGLGRGEFATLILMLLGLGLTVVP